MSPSSLETQTYLLLRFFCPDPARIRPERAPAAKAAMKTVVNVRVPVTATAAIKKEYDIMTMIGAAAADGPLRPAWDRAGSVKYW